VVPRAITPGTSSGTQGAGCERPIEEETVKEELASELFQYLEQLRNGVEFAIEQAPVVVQQQITYGQVYYSIMGGGGVLFLLVCLAAFAAGIHLTVKSSNDDELASFLCVVGCIGSLVSTMTLIFGVLPRLIQVWFAPSVYVIEWLVGMVEKVGG
jgi:hypothetical protein